MKIAVIIPVYNSGKMLAETLDALRRSTRLPDEMIVVDDASTDGSGTIAADWGAHRITMPSNVGPAACRNHAALYSHSDVLVFLDADTCVHPTTLERIEFHLESDPGLGAVIGSYDDMPRDPGLCSQFRNLAHCHVHRSSKPAALTFWTGCGAVRRDLFFYADGFDERYRSIEDIELGYRLSDRGVRILLDPDICVTHLKRWTLWHTIATDITDRGIPWVALLLERGRAPIDLNLGRRHRVATMLLAAALLCLGASLRSILWLLPACLFLAASLCMHLGLLWFIYRKRGPRLLFVAVTMTLIQDLCKLAAVTAGTLVFVHRLLPSTRTRRGERRSEILLRRGATEQSLQHGLISMDIDSLGSR